MELVLEDVPGIKDYVKTVKNKKIKYGLLTTASDAKELDLYLLRAHKNIIDYLLDFFTFFDSNKYLAAKFKWKNERGKEIGKEIYVLRAVFFDTELFYCGPSLESLSLLASRYLVDFKK